MTDNTALLYKQILDASYNIYVDINSINSAMSRASSMMGLPQKQALTLQPRTEVPTTIEPSTKQNESFKQTVSTTEAAKTREETVREKAQGYHVIGRERDIPVEMQPLATGLKEKKPEGPTGPLSTKPLGPQKLPEVEMQKVEIPKVVSPAKTESLEQKQERIKEMEKVSLSVPKVQTPVTSINMENIPEIDVMRTNENPVSNLLNLVKSKGSITISDAAAQLNVSRTLIEKWAKILNQSSLLRIKYQMVGDIVMEA